MQQRHSITAGLGICLILGVFYVLSKAESAHDVKETRFLLGTLVEFTVAYEGEASFARQAIARAAQVMQAVEHRFTTHGASQNSVKRFNQALPLQQVKLDTQVDRLLKQSLHLHQQTAGAFDPALGNLNRLWGFSGDLSPHTPPSAKHIAQAVIVSGAQHLQPHRSQLWSKNVADLELDFGAIAKGLAIDEAMDVLKEMGIKHAIINAGGDLRILGNHVDKPWRIAVRHPRKQTPLGWFEIDQDVSIVTSGDYERFYKYQGQRYHHILNPQTGMPAQASMSVTVLANTATKADALSTAMFVLGANKGLSIVEGMPDVEAIWVNKKGDILMSSGVQNWFDFVHVPGDDE